MYLKHYRNKDRLIYCGQISAHLQLYLACIIILYQDTAGIRNESVYTHSLYYSNFHSLLNTFSSFYN